MSKADNMLAIFVDAETREERSSPALERKKHLSVERGNPWLHPCGTGSRPI